MSTMRKLFLILLLIFAIAARAAEVGPIGKPGEVMSEPYLLGSWTHLYEVFPSRMVPRAGPVLELLHQPENLESVSYRFSDGRRTIADYIKNARLTSLLVLKDGRIAYERYWLGTDEHTLFTSWSMAKSVTSTLLGLLVNDGTIASIDDLASAYVPELKQSGYYDVRLRDLLQMSSGVTFREEASEPDSLEARLWVDGMIERRLPINHALLWFDEKDAQPGSRFSYASIETLVLGWVIERQAGKPLAQIFSERVWQKIGAEHDANWTLDAPGGTEIASCCLNATTRDYGRLGLLYMNGGRVGEQQVLPPAWLKLATKPDPTRPDLQPGALADGEPLGYQHFWWLWPVDGAFTAFGHGGQWLYMNPRERIVIVQTAVLGDGTNVANKRETVRAFQAIVDKLSGS